MKTKEPNKEMLRDLSKCVTPLISWYENNKRTLPWREEVSAYRVWVSEIMLQQTRVEAVKPYFQRFMEAYPTIQSLAGAQAEELLKMWEGLGYYSRVRNMQKAAQVICERHGGQMPDTYEELLELPGIGSYTAGAISSIAFNRAVPAVDGNVLRVLARLTMDGADIADTKVRKRVFEELSACMPKESGIFNQALMELGATVCLPNGMPKCEICPWRDLCEARKAGRMMEFPYKSPKKARKIEEKTLFIIRDGERVLLHQRADKGLLAGLYEFPMTEGTLSPQQAIETVREMGFAPLMIQKLPQAKHIFTHKEWHMTGYMLKVEPFDEMADMRGQDLHIVSPKDTKDAYPIPSAFSAFTPYVGIALTGEYIKTELPQNQ